MIFSLLVCVPHSLSVRCSVSLRTVARALQVTCLGLSGGRGFAKARTGGELPKSCEVSHETAPRLTPNPSLCEGVCLFFYLNRQTFNYAKCPLEFVVKLSAELSQNSTLLLLCYSKIAIKLHNTIF